MNKKKIKTAIGIIGFLIAIGLILTGLIGLQKQNLCENTLQDAIKQYCQQKDKKNNIATYKINPDQTITIYCKMEEQLKIG